MARLLQEQQEAREALYKSSNGDKSSSDSEMKEVRGDKPPMDNGEDDHAYENPMMEEDGDGPATSSSDKNVQANLNELPAIYTES